MSGTLYVIGTPIGNLEDMTLRQLRMLQEVDFIAAEDTRVTRKLLSHYDIHTPMVFYEAPHKLLRTLTDMVACFGGERPVSICRELTKLHEEVWKTTLAEALHRYEQQPPKGEFVLIVAGMPESTDETTRSMEDALQQVQERVAQGERLTDACKAVAAETGYRKQDLYQQAIQERESE